LAHADCSIRTGTIFDEELLAELLGQARRQDARRCVRKAAGGERHDDAHRPIGIVALRKRGGRGEEKA
jgi:hypothetical protein